MIQMRVMGLVAIVLLTACTSEEQREADAVKKIAAQDMKDPSSAQFRNLKIRLASLCGEINAKNSFGAYTGFKRFKGNTGAVIHETKIEEGAALPQSERAKKFWTDQAKEFDEEYKECQRNGKPVT